MAKKKNDGSSMTAGSGGFTFSQINNFLNEISEDGGMISEIKETRDLISTGIYVSNALISGSIYGGIPSNAITAFGGESGCLYPDEKIKIYSMQTKKREHTIKYEKLN